MDIRDIGLFLTFDQIESLSKEMFKKVVKEKVKKKSFDYLTEIQATHSKAKNIVYNNLSL